MSRIARALAVLVFVAVFLASPVTAASLPDQTGSSSIWDSVWAWVMDLFVPDDDADGGIDPNGGQPPAPGTHDDLGGGIDPNG